MKARSNEDWVMAVLPPILVAILLAGFGVALLYGPRYARTMTRVDAHIVTTKDVRHFDPSGAILGGVIGHQVGSLLLGDDFGLLGGGVGFAMGGSKRRCEMPVIVADSLVLISAPRYVCREMTPGQEVLLEKHTETKLDKDGKILSVSTEYRWP